MESPKVFVLILNYNGKDTLTRCLQSVYQTDYPNFEVAVVDNDSKDGSLEEAKNLFPRAHFIKNSANLGFAAGNNIGIRFALEKMADYVWVLNNDTKIEKDTLSQLVSEGENSPKIGILSPLILHSKTKNIWFGGGKIHWLSMKTTHVPPQSLYNAAASDYICGCAMLVKKDVFRKAGLFDEHFFLYYEDADLSVRARKAGFELRILPKAHVFHDEASAANPDKVYWLVVSGLQFFRKHTPWYLKPWTALYLLARKTKNRYDILLRKNPLAPEVRRAYLNYQAVSQGGK
jgi:GT2 family glycosyltransferase